jgi:hypothetical protein
VRRRRRRRTALRTFPQSLSKLLRQQLQLLLRDEQSVLQPLQSVLQSVQHLLQHPQQLLLEPLRHAEPVVLQSVRDQLLQPLRYHLLQSLHHGYGGGQQQQRLLLHLLRSLLQHQPPLRRPTAGQPHLQLWLLPLGLEARTGT